MATLEMEPAPRSAASGTVKFVYGVFGAAVVAYTVLLFARGNGVGWTWLDGWGTATFEALMCVMILARVWVRPRNSKYCLWIGLGGLAWSSASRWPGSGRDRSRSRRGRPPRPESARQGVDFGVWRGFSGSTSWNR